jgi:alpha-beta hydrolase superfamily lysophospholipase
MRSFLSLKSALTPLRFDPARDTEPEGFTDYSRFYQLDFPSVIHHIGTVDSDSYRLAVQYWLPDNAKATVLVVHGYYDHVGLYRHAIEFFLTHGYAVIAFDLPGHGLSSGARAVIHDFDEYGQAIHAVIHAAAHTTNNALPPITVGFGQSTGCAAWMNYTMAGFIFSVQKLIFFSPLLRPYHWQQQGRWAYMALQRLVTSVPRSFRANSSDTQFLRFCRDEDPLQPRHLTVAWVGAMKHWMERFNSQPNIHTTTLILQGEQDDTVDWRFNIPAIIQKIPHAQVHYLAEAHHHLVNESKTIRTRAWQVVGTFLEQEN